MKTCRQSLFLLLALTTGLGLMPTGRTTAQTFTILHGFTNNPEGANPGASLVLSSNTLYGTTINGGANGDGTVFAINNDGTGFTNLYCFTSINNSTNSDGANPAASLILSGNTLYGTASVGGGSGNGTVFRLNTDGTAFTNLHNFTTTTGGPIRSGGTNADGAHPHSRLVISGKTLYGTARNGGNLGSGTVFAVNTDGSGFTNLHSFNGSDGLLLNAGLVLSSNILYGATSSGGSSGNGTVFAINTDGNAFTNLYSFSAIGVLQTNSDGRSPIGGLILLGNTLYGTANAGGSSGSGTVFAVNTDGTAFTNLHSFTQISNSAPHANTDGAAPQAGLILSGHTLYGTASAGGSSGNGTVFAVNTDGSGLTNLYSFTASSESFPNITNSDGAVPPAGLILSGNNLFGAAEYGGNSGCGTVFALSLQVPSPQLALTYSGVNVILTWPTNAPGFTLESATNLVSPVVWSSVSPAPIIVNGQNTVTNPFSGTQMFFRLSQ